MKWHVLWITVYRISQKVAHSVFADFSEMGGNFNKTFYTFIQKVYLCFFAGKNLIDFNNVEVIQFLAIFAHSKMHALQSHRYVKITNNNNGLVFHHEIFHISSVLSSKCTCGMKFLYL